MRYFFVIISLILFLSGCDDEKINPREGWEWTTYTTKNGLAGNEVYDVMVDYENVVWFGTEYGVSRFTNSEWFSFISQEDNSWNYITDIDIHPVKNEVWISTLNGVIEYSDDNYNYRSYGQGIAFNHVYGAAFEGDKVWIATQKGVSLYDGGSWENITEGEGLGQKWVSDIAVDKNGTLWFTTKARGVVSLAFNKGK